jgi:hypothetical protein
MYDEVGGERLKLRFECAVPCLEELRGSKAASRRVEA